MPETKLYIGAKIIRAYRQSKNGEPGYTVIYPDGYASWSPEATFETAYRLVTPEEKEMANG